MLEVKRNNRFEGRDPYLASGAATAQLLSDWKQEQVEPQQHSYYQSRYSRYDL